MREHTSKELTLDEDLPDCWCGHLDQDHHVQWLQNAGESEFRALGAFYAVVHCVECMKESVAIQMGLGAENMKSLRALAVADEGAARLLKMEEAVDGFLQRIRESADVEEVQEIVKQYEKLYEEYHLDEILAEPPEKDS